MQRDKDVIIGGRIRAPLLKIALEACPGGRMQGHQPTLAEFGLADQQAVGGDVRKPQPDRFGHPQAGARQQGKEGAVGRAAERGRPGLRGCVDELLDLLGGEDVRGRPWRKLYDSTGLTFIGSYTWGHALGTAPSGPDINEFQPIRDVRHFEADYGPTGYDLRHIYSFSWSYELPIGHGKPFGSGISSGLNRVLGGWKLAGIVSGRSGNALTVGDVVDRSNAGGSRPDLVCDPSDHDRANRSAAIRQWFNTACFVRAPAFTFGTAGVGVVRGPGYHNVDLSLQKGIAMGGGRRLELRADVFNAFNRAHLGDPSTAFGTGGFGTISGTIGTARQMQLGARFEF